MIITSYFANWRNYPRGLRLISVSRFKPKGVHVDEVAFELAPSMSLLRGYHSGRITITRYKQIYYNDVLSKLDPREIYRKYDNSLLLCYEKSGRFCHRRLIAEWLEVGNSCTVLEL